MSRPIGRELIDNAVEAAMRNEEIDFRRRGFSYKFSRTLDLFQKNSICRVNTLCNGQRDISAVGLSTLGFLISLFIALKNERTIANVTSRSSRIREIVYTYLLFFLSSLV